MITKFLLFLFIVLSIVFFVAASYFYYQVYSKRKKKKSLHKELKDIFDEIGMKKQEVKKLESKMARMNEEFSHLKELEKNEIAIRDSLKISENSLMIIKEEIATFSNKKNLISKELEFMKRDISLYKPVHNLIELGFTDEPEYLQNTSEVYKEQLKAIRERQKELIANQSAIIVPESIALTNNGAHAKKVLNGQSRLMLKALNTECDLLLSKVKTSNYPRILERIDRLAGTIEKAAASLKCGFSKEYIELKYKECELQYHYKLKEAREKEEQALIKEQMKEEQKAIKEFERALAKAQKEEQMYRKALEDVKNELTLTSDKDRNILLEKISVLEKQLQEAEENEKRAISMAEQTKRGHVYVISNIGSFGENIYKIGLTRRLEPLDRVKELGGASVPFSFDVHAMIYSEDAPALESQLHREFSKFRVNQVQLRKEFFDVDLAKIREKVIEITGNELDFKVTALAEDYYESLEIRRSLEAKAGS